AAVVLPAAFVSCTAGIGLDAPRIAAKANATCMECHIDFDTEEIVVVHGTHGVTCVRCHGPSRAHMEDEVRKTKADVTFRGQAMRLFCLTCHKPEKHRRVRNHAAELARPPHERRACTACHGEHKLLEIEPASRPGKTQTQPTRVQGT
ncbi:MAG: cytochrome c3 family protein, partial [Phycisphaerae bacterium]